LSGSWALAVFVKNWLYDRHILPIRRVSAPVISIGNLVAGGSGKTPLVHLLAQSLSDLGPIAIISRGYLAKKSGLALGDELTMLSRRLPLARCFANPDRTIAAKEAINCGARLLILDDAFQHRRLHRDFDFVVIDAANPFGYRAFLPCGLLRDPPSRLKDAHAIFINGRADDRLREDLRRWSQSPQVEVSLCLEKVLNLKGEEQNKLAGCKVGAFCAIGQPRRFFDTLSQTHAEIVDRCVFPDHEKFEISHIQEFADRCRRLGATAIICSEKDAIKIQFDCTILPIYYLEMQLKVVYGKENWRQLIEKIHSTSKGS